MELTDYFERADTPTVGSPVGITMVKVLTKFPGMSPADARLKAQELLNVAAKSVNYRGPRVLSEAEQTAAREALKKAFGKAA